MIGVIVFGWLFLIITKGITGDDTLVLKSFVDISNQSFPAIGSILLIALDVTCVLYLHELIHAAVVFTTHRQKPHIGIRGFVIFAAAGGDFMDVIWALKQPKNTKFIDYGDITNAYINK